MASKSKILKLIPKLPDSPGVYFFKRGRKILYIGKATSLRSRVSSYLQPTSVESRGETIKAMMTLATSIVYRTTDSILEALLLEIDQIRKWQPKYNTRDKDQKTFQFVIITQEQWPRVLMKRGSQLNNSDTPSPKHLFGPFPSARELRLALKIIRRIFPFRDHCAPQNGVACFDYQLGLCPGVCNGKITASEYQQSIRRLVKFFHGGKQQVIKELKQQMTTAARNMDFELAKVLRDQLFSLQHIQDVSLIGHRELVEENAFRIEAYDIAHFGGKETVGAMVVINAGSAEPASYRKFRLRGPRAATPDDPANLAEVLHRRLQHSEWPQAQIIVVDGGQAQVNMANKVLAEMRRSIPIVGVVKNERHQPQRMIGPLDLIEANRRSILLANSEAHRFSLAYHRQRHRRIV